jgi:hypothetical protein
MAVDQKAPLELKCKLRERPNPIGRRFVLPSGKAVMGYNLMKVRTTAAAATLVLDKDTGLGYVALQNNELYTVTAHLVATQVAGSAGTVGDSAVVQLAAGAKRLATAGTTALVGAVVPVLAVADAGAAAWTAVLAADAVNGGLKVTVTGAVNKTIDWEVALYIEIGLPIAP